jgi:hypothetical protein
MAYRTGQLIVLGHNMALFPPSYFKPFVKTRQDAGFGYRFDRIANADPTLPKRHDPSMP